MTIPVSFTYAGIGAAGRQLLNTGAVNYRVLGDVTVGIAGRQLHGAVLVAPAASPRIGRASR